jgi:hypothetical protein
MGNVDLRFYLDILQTLERLGIQHVIIGAFAGTSYGVTRTTFDIDIVVELKEPQIIALADAYPSPRFYADPEQMRDAIRWGTLFNIIDSSTGRKVDLIPLTMKPGYDFALAQRIRRDISMTDGATVSAWFARPEDVIVGKLMAWSEGGSFKHESDIRDIWVAIQLEDDPDLSAMFDVEYVDAWAKHLGENVEQFWQNLKAVTQDEAK